MTARKTIAPILSADYRTVPTAVLLWLILLATGFCTEALAGADQPPAGAEVATEPPSSLVAATPAVSWTADEIEKLRKQTLESTILAEEARAKVIEAIDKALSQLKLLEQSRSQKAIYLKSREEAGTELQKAQSELSKPLDETLPTISPEAKLTEIEQNSTAAKTFREEAEKKAALLENEPKRRIERKTKIPEEKAAVSEQLKAVNERLAAFQPDPKTPELSQAQKMNLDIQRQALVLKLEMLDEELRFYEATSTLLTAQRDLAARTVSRATTLLKFWEDAFKKAKLAEAERIKAEAKAVAAEARYAHSFIKKLADENTPLADLQKKVSEQIEQSKQYGRDIDAQVTAIEDDFKQIQGQLAATEEITHVMGILLLTKRKDIPSLTENIVRIKSREGKAAYAQLMWGDYDRRWTRMSNIDAYAQGLMAESGILENDPNFVSLKKQAMEILAEQRKLVRKISDDYLDYSEVLARNDLQERKLVQTVDDYAYFIDEHILWVRSSTILTLEDFRKIWPAAQWLFSGKNWRGVLSELGKDIRQNTVPYLLFAPVFLAFLLFRRRARRTMNRLTEQIMHKYSDSFVHTWKTLGITLLLTLTFPTLILFLAWRIRVGAGDDEFALALSMAMHLIGMIVAVFAFLKHFCYPGALGAQLGFPAEVLETLRGHLVWFFSMMVPLAFMVEIFRTQQADTDWQSTLGRLFFMAEQIVLVVFLMIVLRPKGKVLRAYMEKTPRGWLNQLRYLWYGIVLVVPLALLVIAELGYLYAAQRLHNKLLWSIFLIAVVVLLNAMLHRWVAVLQEKIEIHQKRQQLEARRAAEETGKESDHDQQAAAITPSGLSEEGDVAVVNTISRQAIRLIRLVNLLLVGVGMWAIWHNVLPALGILNDVVIWSTTDAAGNPRVVDASCLAMALFFLLLTVIMARNLPGLLQVSVLQRLPLDAGVRFAVTALLRYLIVIVGIVLTFNRIGIGWSKVQWLIAAMTVGLGFGLQEIFANFISGLIILFEQPIRVGDLVTIGDVNGKVAKIRIRATTLRKWDQKELIVPNKEFITGRLINWTLSDKTIRMDFTVGVAYGSDIKKTETTLYRIARKHPLIMHDEPATMVVFRAFGDSSLDFQLRVFVPNMDNYLKVWHEINCAIDTEFRKEGIEIAFPQRDLHIRSSDVPFGNI